MKTSLAFAVASGMVFGTVLTHSAVAHASGPSNISGISERLESVECRGAYVMKLSDFVALAESACPDTIPAEEELACAKAAIQAHASFDRAATFMMDAIAGETGFLATIESDGRSVFRSHRNGTHGDGFHEQIALIFTRPGVDNDEYAITVEEEATIVPVKRRLLPDLIFLFLDGCEKRWQS